MKTTKFLKFYNILKFKIKILDDQIKCDRFYNWELKIKKVLKRWK